MLKMTPYAPSNRIVIRDSIDEEISDDVDDEVFIKEGRFSKRNEDSGVKRPLMTPRYRKNKNLKTFPIMKKPRKCWKPCEPFIYGLIAITILIVLIIFAALLLTLFPIPLQKMKSWLHPELNLKKQIRELDTSGSEFVSCLQISVQKIWSKSISRINSESPVRTADLNGDMVDDIIFGYGIDDSIQYTTVQTPVCLSSRQDEKIQCGGGVIALDGKTGEIIWQRWTVSNVFSLYCTTDVTADETFDCIVGGRGGLIIALDGKDGNIIWQYRETEAETNSPILIDLYTVSSIRDLDSDSIPDILAAHVEERENSRAGHIKLLSGKNGKVIRSIPTPYREEIFVPIQIVTKRDGTEVLLILTGGQNTGGGIYSLRLYSVMRYIGDTQFIPLFQSNYSGFMTQAILTDINGDAIDDIIVNAFNSTVYAFDGRNSSLLWSYTFPAAESISSIVPGYYNDDKILDFLIKYNFGPGFPIYYYSETNILNGINGQPLLDKMIVDSGGSSSILGGKSISQTFGGDFFLHWQTKCRGKDGEKDAYQFIPESDIILQARADTCLLRYNTSTVLKLYAIARHIEPPGAVIFSSDDLNIRLRKIENNFMQQNSVSPLKHPKMLKKLLKESANKNNLPLAKTIYNNNKLIEKNNFQDIELGSDRLNYMKPYQYHTSNEQLDNEFSDYEPEPKSQDEFGILYNEPQQNDRPIHLRTKYPNNRNIRSDILENVTYAIIDNTSYTTEKFINDRIKEEPLSLWDLELEKENEEALQERNSYEYISRQIRDNSKNDIIPNDNIIPSIASSGALLSPINNSLNSIDYVFIINIRESEVYPPLLFEEDLKCIKDKLSGYKSYSKDDLENFEKKFLKQCLKARLQNINPIFPRYESQIIVTRISITCTCGNLSKNQVCSSIENIIKQQWI